MSCRRVTFSVAAAILLSSTLAAAQGVSGTVDVLVTTKDGASAGGATVEIVAADGGGVVRSARVPGAGGAISLPAPIGTYRLRVEQPGFHGIEHALTLGPGVVVAIRIRLSPASAPEPSVAAEDDRYPSSYQTTFGRPLLEGLPSSQTVWSMAETSHPFLVSDRIDGGGLWTGEPAYLGGQGSSARQLTFRLDGLDVTDPEVTGTPLVHPDLDALQAMVVESATIDPAAAGPGPSVDLILKRPGKSWGGTARIAGSPESLQSEGGDIAPIARLVSWIDGSLAAGGPVAARFGLFALGRVTTGKRVEREQPLTLEGTSRSALAHLVGNPGPQDEVRLLASFNGATRPLANRARFADRSFDEQDRSVILQGAWSRMRGGAQWSLGGAYQRGSREADVPPDAAGGTIERLQDGAPFGLVASGEGTRQRWDVQGGLVLPARSWLGGDHYLQLGAIIGGASAENQPGVQPPFAELVHGIPARVWDVGFRGPQSRWSSVTASAFVSDRIPVNDRVTILAGLRLDSDHGSADGAPDSIGWLDLSPRVSLRWRPWASGRPFVVNTGYAWYAQRLPLDLLAVGDPAGPAGIVYRWDDVNGDRAYSPSELTQVGSIGLCCAGGEASRIDGQLQRPTTREFRIGAEDVVFGWRWSITGIDRRENNLVGLVNTGVTGDDYTATYVSDPGIDILGNSGYEQLPIYNRRPETLGHDRFVLTNPDIQATRHQAFEVGLERAAGDRFIFRFGGTAYRTEGVGANRNYRADENDQGLLGEAFATPNARTNARGRLFYDRAFMMKVLGAYTGPGPVRGSFVARYQDGQPFARMVIAEGLTQGTDFVQAYPRGGQRFTYTLTLDARIEAEWPLGERRALGVALDAFNLLDTANEVEEDVATGPGFRTITAVQPPRVLRLGLRFTF